MNDNAPQAQDLENLGKKRTERVAAIDAHHSNCILSLLHSTDSKDWTLMPIVLSASLSNQGREAAELLDGHGVAFAYVEVTGSMGPRLQIGDDELSGLEEIRAHIGEIVQLSLA